MYRHHEESLKIMEDYFRKRKEVIALIFGGSVAKGMERPDSDLDAMVIVPDAYYETLLEENRTAETIDGLCTYEGGYFDVKYMTKDYLRAAAERGSEPTRNSFIGSRVLFSSDPEIEGLVQTSLNLGILTTEADTLRAVSSLRSSVDSQKEMLKRRLAALLAQLGGHVEYEGEYTGWQYQEHSPLRELMVQVYTEQYGEPPRVEAIHAGLECGLFAGKMPGLDCVSIGPNLQEIHTPRERMSISSVQRVWKFLLEVLKRAR